MRILMIAPQPFFIERGTPLAQELLTRALSERGEEVDLVVYHLGEDVRRPGLTIHRAAGPRWIRSVRPGFSPRKLLCDVYLARKAWQLARRHHYDVVHASEEGVLIAMALKATFGIPYVYDMDSSIAQQTVEQAPWLKPLTPLLRWIERRAIRGSRAVAPVCSALADLARTQGARYVETLHDISQLTAGGASEEAVGLRKRLGINGPIVLYVGNLEPYQGVRLLLESAARVTERRRDFHLVIAGGVENDIAAHRALAEDLGIQSRSHFIGPWPAERLGALLREADILASPRVRGINTPMKIFPYLHSGRPVLATEITSHTQILHNDVAVLAPPEPVAFAAALERLLDDPELRQRLGAAGRDLVERDHTFDAYRRRLNRLYDHVAGAPGEAGGHTVLDAVEGRGR